MFDEHLFFFVSLKIGISYKVKKSACQARQTEPAVGTFPTAGSYFISSP